MTTDLSRRSSVTASAHAPSPRGNGVAPPPSHPQQLGETSSSIRRSPSLGRDSGKPADTDAPVASAAESQPITASNSNSSNTPANDVAGSGTGAAVPYGTRSRNRTGTSRPNYAEDKELDVDFEVTVPAKENKESNGRKTTRGGSDIGSASLETGRAVGTTRKTGPDAGHFVTVQSHYKDPIPGTSTFSANPTVTTVTTQPSKKRKAASQSSTPAAHSQAQLSNHGASADHAAARKASMATQVIAGFRATNMLSFDNCGARLEGGKLRADDGTILEVNGK
jgi:hypothetical protein